EGAAAARVGAGRFGSGCSGSVLRRRARVRGRAGHGAGVVSRPARRPLSEAVRAACGVAVRDARGVGGGDINEAYRVELEDGTRAFVKTRADVAPGEYATEADGLRWLGAARGATALGGGRRRAPAPERPGRRRRRAGAGVDRRGPGGRRGRARARARDDP